MKRPLAIFMLACLVLPFAGTYAWLQCEKSRVKREVKRQMIAGMDKTELVFLRFTSEQASKELSWEHEHEFRFRGSMYDVVETDLAGDTLFYWCWPDDEETALNRQLEVLVAEALGESAEEDDDEKNLEDFFEELYLPTRFISGIDFNDKAGKFMHPGHSPSYSSCCDSPPVPPPEMG